MHKQSVKNYLQSLQQTIVQGLESFESNVSFQTDQWQHEQGGGGRSSVLEGGDVFEKAGVNFSHVQGKSLPPSATAQRPELNGKAFEAMGVSLVIHPRNPFVPTTHMNVRYFDADDQWWFGGGFDLTPYYPFAEDVVHWHTTAQKACQPFGEQYYPRFKAWCDEYFYLKHRGETRGVGGLFFDDFNELGFEQSFDFLQSIGDHFLPAYAPIVEQRTSVEYNQQHRDFQAYRRGRYVEFNLVYDRGTLFGLQAGGRIESILMSLPPVANWRYDWHPQPDSEEATLYDYLQPRDWI